MFLLTMEIYSYLGQTKKKPALLTLHKWAVQFRKERKTIEDYPKSGRPATSTTEENMNCFHHMVIDDRRVKII